MNEEVCTDCVCDSATMWIEIVKIAAESVGILGFLALFGFIMWLMFRAK